MDYKPKKRQKRHQGSGFTLFRETPNPHEEEESKIEIAPELSLNEFLVEQSIPLATTQVGDCVWVVGFQGNDGINRLLSLGLIPGMELKVVSCTLEGSVLVTVGGSCFSFGAGIAQKIFVTTNLASIKKKEQQMLINSSTYLRDMPVGARVRVVDYEKVYRGYKGRLLSMGLTPGAEFTVIRHVPLDNLVEIEVEGFRLSLRKQEADALCIEEVGND